MADLTLKTGDTYPPLEAVLTADGGVLDLTNAKTVTLRMKGRERKTLVTGPCTHPLPKTGNVIYKWGPTDTAVPDTYDCEWVVEWADGTLETFPNDGTKTVNIEAHVQ